MEEYLNLINIKTQKVYSIVRQMNNNMPLTNDNKQIHYELRKIYVYELEQIQELIGLMSAEIQRIKDKTEQNLDRILIL